MYLVYLGSGFIEWSGSMSENKKFVRAETFKVAGYVPIPVNEEVNRVATVSGLTKSQTVSILIQLGLKSWQRIYEPEKLLDADAWEKILRNYDESKKD